MLELAAPAGPGAADLDLARSTASRGASAGRELLGQRQPNWRRAPATTRASAARRRCSSTTRGSTSADQGRADLQHLRAPACGPTTGASCPISWSKPWHGKPITDLRRRHPDPLLLLRRRPRRGADPPHGRPLTGSPGPINLGNPGEYTMLRPGQADQSRDRRDSNAGIEYHPLPRTTRESGGAPRSDQAQAASSAGSRGSTALADGLARAGLAHYPGAMAY